MRTRTDEKRREIVGVAAELFLELGYEGTSMSLVSRRLGGSKATLYSYFGSKDELFLAVVDAESERFAGEAIPLDRVDDVRQLLRRVGLRFIEARTSARAAQLFRIVASLPAGSAVDHGFRSRLAVPGFARLCALMKALVDKGLLRLVDPRILAMHFKALVEGDLFERPVLALGDTMAPREMEQAATGATDTFLRAYAAQVSRTL